jgi:hypothetical protein
MIIAKKPENEGKFEMIPAGTHQAVCYAVWDIGKQTVKWDNETKQQHKIIVSWEIKETMKTKGEYFGKRFVINNRYTLSLGNKAKLREHLISWRGQEFTAEEEKSFDIEKLIGVNCYLSVTHNKSKDGSKTYANISAIMKLPPGIELMKPENGTEPPEWVQKLQGASTVQAAQEVFDINPSESKDVPF